MAETAGERAARYRTEQASPADTSYLDTEAATPQDSVAVEPAAVPAPAPSMPALSKYEGNDLDQAKINHIANGIRTKLAHKFNFGSLTDEQVLQRHRTRFADVLTPEEYDAKLKETYLKDFQPTLMQRVAPAAHLAGEAAVGIAPFLMEQTPKAVAAVVGKVAPALAAGATKAASVVSKAIPGVSQAAFLAGHTINAAVDSALASGLEQQMTSLPGGDPEVLAQDYFAKLRPGLSAQGFNDDEIMGEAKRRANNIARSHQQTLDSIDEDIDMLQRAAVGEPAKAVTDALFLGFGAGPLQKLMNKMGLGFAEKAAMPAVKKGIVGAVAKHATTGAVVGGVSLGAGAATRAAIEASADTMSPAQIAQQMIEHGIEEAKMGGIGGALLGGAAGVLEGGINKLATGAAKKAARAEAAEGEVAAANVRAIREHQTRNAAKPEINPEYEAQIRSHWESKRDLQMANTAASFDAIKSRYPIDMDPIAAAKNVLVQEHGPDALRTEAGLKAISDISKKIRLSQAANAEVANFGTRELPPSGAPLIEGERPFMTQPGAIAGPGQFAESAPTYPVRPLEPNMRMKGTSPEPQNTMAQPLPEQRALPALEQGMTELPAPAPVPAPPTKDQLAAGWAQELEFNPKKPRAPKAIVQPTETAAVSAPNPVVGERSEPVAPVAGSSPLSEKVPTSSELKTTEPVAPVQAAPTGVSTAIEKLADETHANIQMSEDGKSLKIQLGVKPGEVAKQSGTATALDRIVKTADEHGLPVETYLTPPEANKGRIPLEKVIPWYEARGFRVVESSRIPEGNLAAVRMVREPIGSHHVEVVNKLEAIAKAADERLTKKLGRMNAGFDVSMVGDASLKLAANMFAKRLRSRAQLVEWVENEWGNRAKPFVDRIIDLAQKHFIRMFRDTGTAEVKLKELLELKESGNYGMNWYEDTSKWAKERFGKDSDMFLRFLAITSANGQTESGAALALKSFAQWQSGMEFTGLRGPSMVNQMKLAAAEKPLPEHTKIKNFLDALRGDPDAVVLDRWMMDALNMKDSGGSLPSNKYRIYEEAVRQLAKDNDMTPRQFQAAVWEGARVRKAHVSEATGGRALSSKIGSARPLEELVERKLNGMTPEEYGKAVIGDLKQMDNLYNGLAPVRTGIEKGERGQWAETPGAPESAVGHTFDPETFKPAKHKGFVVTMLSHNTDRGRLYPARILKFKKAVAPLLAELEQQGHKPTIGVFRLTNKKGAPTGEFSIDLNIMLKDEAQAVELGRLNKQFAVAELGKGGEWLRNIETGHSGKQYQPPNDYREQPAWYRQQMNRARAFIRKAGL